MKKLVLFLALAASGVRAHDPKPETERTVAYLTRLKLKPGTETAFLKEVRTIIDFSRAEPGNIAWFVQQSVDDPTEIVFYTRWVDQAAIEWHLNADPVKRYIERSNALLAEPARLTRYRPLDIER